VSLSGDKQFGVLRQWLSFQAISFPEAYSVILLIRQIFAGRKYLHSNPVDIVFIGLWNRPDYV